MARQACASQRSRHREPGLARGTDRSDGGPPAALYSFLIIEHTGARRPLNEAQGPKTKTGEDRAAMYKKIMVPVDLAHTDRLQKALDTAADLANHYGIPLCYVGVTTGMPGSVAHNPQEYEKKLKEFASSESARRGMEVEAKTYMSHDPSIDLDQILMKAIHELGADLVVMASHVPGVPEHVFSSNAGYLASHADVSVLVVR